MSDDLQPTPVDLPEIDLNNLNVPTEEEVGDDSTVEENVEEATFEDGDDLEVTTEGPGELEDGQDDEAEEDSK